MTRLRGVISPSGAFIRNTHERDRQPRVTCRRHSIVQQARGLHHHGALLFRLFHCRDRIAPPLLSCSV